jgi:hypothetical protein
MGLLVSTVKVVLLFFARNGLGYFFHCKSSVIIFHKKWIGLHFWRLFSQTHPVTLTKKASFSGATFW